MVSSSDDKKLSLGVDPISWNSQKKKKSVASDMATSICKCATNVWD